MELEPLREVQYTFHLRWNNAKWKLYFKCERCPKHYASTTEIPNHTRNILLSQVMPIKAETAGPVKIMFCHSSFHDMTFLANWRRTSLCLLCKFGAFTDFIYFTLSEQCKTCYTGLLLVGRSNLATIWEALYLSLVASSLIYPIVRLVIFEYPFIFIRFA